MNNAGSKKMFGGYGIFYAAKMLGIISSKGECFFKVNEETQQEYDLSGSTKHSRMPYFTVLQSIQDDTNQFVSWAKKSIKILKV